MKKKVMIIISSILILIISVIAIQYFIACANCSSDKENSFFWFCVWDLVLPVTPYILLFCILYFFVWKATRLHPMYFQRSQAHMDSMERKFDHMIDLIEKVTAKHEMAEKKNGSKSP